jgi:uncharacterized protein (TIGR02118 family)
MAKLLVLYNKPEDPAAFDAYYHGTHVPLVRKVPGLRSFSVSKGAVAAPRGEAPYYLVAELNFDSPEALQAGLASPEGAATARDLRNFAGAGVTMLIFDTTTESLNS